MLADCNGQYTTFFPCQSVRQFVLLGAFPPKKGREASLGKPETSGLRHYSFCSTWGCTKYWNSTRLPYKWTRKVQCRTTRLVQTTSPTELSDKCTLCWFVHVNLLGCWGHNIYELNVNPVLAHKEARQCCKFGLSDGQMIWFHFPRPRNPKKFTGGGWGLAVLKTLTRLFVIYGTFTRIAKLFSFFLGGRGPPNIEHVMNFLLHSHTANMGQPFSPPPPPPSTSWGFPSLKNNPTFLIDTQPTSWKY